MQRKLYLALVLSTIASFQSLFVSCAQPGQPAQPSRTTGPPAATGITPLPAFNSDSLELMFQDDFSTNTWQVSSDNDCSREYRNGEYLITVSKANWNYWSSSPFPMLSNGVIEVDARPVSNPETAQYGIIFREKDSAYYRFKISGGSFAIDKYQGSWSTLFPFTKSAYINTDGKVNRLRVAYLGNKIEVYVNDQRLATATDESLTIGKISLCVADADKESTVAFDNLKILRFTDAYVANITPAPSASYAASTSTPAAGPASLVLAQQTIPSSGGTITIAKPGDPFDGLELNVPPDAYQAPAAFKVSSATAPPVNMPDVRALTPLLVIDNGGVSSDRILDVKIPVKIPDDEFAMAFYFDQKTGRYEALHRALGRGSAIFAEDEIIADATTGDVKYHGLILAEAPGHEKECRNNLLDAFEEIRLSPEIDRVVDTYKELEQSTSTARRPLQQLLLLGLIPGYCGVCRRLGL